MIEFHEYKVPSDFESLSKLARQEQEVRHIKKDWVGQIVGVRGTGQKVYVQISEGDMRECEPRNLQKV